MVGLGLTTLILGRWQITFIERAKYRVLYYCHGRYIGVILKISHKKKIKDFAENELQLGIQSEFS